MAFLNIPHNFEERLKRDQKLAGTVYSTVSVFGEILQENKLPFFEEYTDHGIKHIEGVLYGSERLIKQETLNHVLTNTDIGNYILAVILHDLGMHLNFEGFQRLLAGDYDDTRVSQFDTMTWKEAWNDFLVEAKRFSGKQLIQLFGDDKVILDDPSLKQKDQLTGKDRKLIGEFVRRHHPRLAHEIALQGMPGAEILPFGKDLDEETRNLVGLVARSHGIVLRKSVDFITEKYGKESQKIIFNCHWPFLMVLLRISDYLQIDSSRSSFNLVLKLRTFQSPYSAIEHDKHNAINNVENRYQEDPERIYVHATPKNGQVHVAIVDLIKSIQSEFDTSWAVLGELYGNFPDKPEIRYRRILCNLEKITDLSNLAYVPKTFNFKANEDIIKLLIEPLYGRNAKYGVRELVQNAVDACKERQSLEHESSYSPLIKVNVWFDGEYYIEIKDNGKGMSLNEIEQFFMTAGASFRSSLDWKKKFVDDKGNSKIERTGRFGVGVLASFLLGEELFVSTRKYDSESGYSFSTKLHNNQIEVLPVKGLEIGTSIKIRSDEKTINTLVKNLDQDSYTQDLNWTDWYQLPTPKIEYIIFGNKSESKNSKLPLPNSNHDMWGEISADDYPSIMWTYGSDWTSFKLFCNGIAIPYNNTDDYLNLGIIENSPVISVSDNNGNLPLSLDRKSLTDSLSFSSELMEDIYKDMIAMLLTLDSVTQVEESKIMIGNQSLNYPGIGENAVTFYHSYGPGNYLNFPTEQHFIDGLPFNPCFLDQILVSKKGYILNYNYFLQHCPRARLLLIQSDTKKKNLTLDLKDHFFLFSNKKLFTIEEHKSAMYGDTMNLTTGNFDKHNITLFLKVEKYHYLFHSDSKRVPDWLKELAKPERQVKDWLILTLDNPVLSILDDAFLTKHTKDLNFIRESPLYCLNQGDKNFNNLLHKYLGHDVVIPFALEDRIKKYPLAFRELERYVRKYLK